MRPLLWLLLQLCSLLLCSASCARQRAFRVLPGDQDYRLRSPDAIETPFPEILRRYNGYQPGRSYVDLRPQMELRIENAYYAEGVPKHGLAGFLGTEIARYQVRLRGLRLTSVEPMQRRPVDQPPVQALIGKPQMAFRNYRFFYAIVFNPKAGTRSSVLLSGTSAAQLDSLTNELLREPESVCGPQLPHCTAFPEACSVSVEMEIVVNGAPRTVVWGSSLGSVLGSSNVQPLHGLQMLRLHAGRLTPVEIDSADEKALRLPLLPGDRVTFK